MKKKIALVLTAAMAVGTLAGCGSSTAQTTTSEQASAQTTDKTEGGVDTVETKPAPAGAKVVKFGNSGAVLDICTRIVFCRRKIIYLGVDLRVFLEEIVAYIRF